MNAPRIYRLRISRITRRMRTIAMMLKQMEEMLHPSPCCVLAAVLRPSEPIASARIGTQGGTRPRSRRDANHRTAAPTSSVAASVSLTRP